MTQPRQDRFGALAEETAQQVADRYQLPTDRTEFERCGFGAGGGAERAGRGCL